MQGGCQKGMGMSSMRGMATPMNNLGIQIPTMQQRSGQIPGMQNPMMRGMMFQNPLPQSGAYAGASAFGAANAFGQAGYTQGIMNQRAQQMQMLQIMQQQRAMLEQILYNEAMMRQYYQQIVNQMNGQGTSPNAVMAFGQMPSFIAAPRLAPTATRQNLSTGFRQASLQR
jgi:hypothetical protein